MDELIRKIGNPECEHMGFNITGITMGELPECTLCVNSSSEPLVLLCGEPYDEVSDDFFAYVDEYISVRYFAIPQDVAMILPYINEFLGTELFLDVSVVNGNLLVSLVDDGDIVYEREFDMSDSAFLVDGTEQLSIFLSAYSLAIYNHRKHRND